jgi:hypothetical protein
MALLFCDGFDHWAEMPHPEVWPTTHPPKRGSVIADLPTMRFIGTPPVTFYLTPCPDGEQLPASVRVSRAYEP